MEGFDVKFRNFINEYLTALWTEEMGDVSVDEAVVGDMADQITAEIFSDFADTLNGYFEDAVNGFLGADESVTEADCEPIDEAFNIKQAFKKVVRNGQIVKVFRHMKKRLSSAQKSALRKARMKANTGMAKVKRLKSLKIRKRKIKEAYINAGISCMIKEAFDIQITKEESFPMEAGYFVSLMDVAEGVISMGVYDADGNLVKEDVMVDADFVSNCFDENLFESLEDYGILVGFESITEEEAPSRKVLEGLSTEVKPAEEETTATEETPPEDTSPVTEEPKDETPGYQLGYTNESGYFVVKDGKKYNMGSRVRARGYLVSEGVDVDAKCFEDAMKGTVTLL